MDIDTCCILISLGVAAKIVRLSELQDERVHTGNRLANNMEYWNSLNGKNKKLKEKD